MHSSRLKSIQSVATIFATVAVPLLVAYYGWQIQRTISSESVKKDYVQIATTVLASPPTPENEELQKWALHILNDNSPIPMSPAAAKSFTRTIVVPGPQLVDTLAETPFLDAPLPMITFEKPSKIFEAYAENKHRCELNTINFKGLQEIVRGMIDRNKKISDGT